MQPADRSAYAAAGRAGLSVPEQVSLSAQEAGDDFDPESLTVMFGDQPADERQTFEAIGLCEGVLYPYPCPCPCPYPIPLL